MKQLRKILGSIVCVALLAAPAFPAAAAGTAGGVRSDTTNPVSRAVGMRYCFTVTPQAKGESIGYTVGNGKLLRTFTAAKTVRNADGTETYTLGFECLSPGETGVYVTVGGKTARLFSVTVTKDTSADQMTYAELQQAADNGHQPWRLNPAEVASQYVTENHLAAKTDTLNDPGVAKNVDGSATVFFAKDGKTVFQVGCYQPLKKAGGIWVVKDFEAAG
jgi:hypothetical protein